MNRLQRWFYKLPLRLRSIFLRRNVERELDEEFQFHLERQIEENIAAVASSSAIVIGSRFQMALFLAFAGAGLLLALAGVYGVTSYAAAQRTKEVGIRLALGATRFEVSCMMLRQSLLPVIAGIGGGLLVASGVTRFLESFLFGVTPLDTTVFLAVPIFLTFVAMLANLIPVRRGSRVDPVTTLKYE